MAYTVNELVSGAFYASGIVSREFETVSGAQLSDGINWLNEVINEKVVDMDMIPYETTASLDLIAGTEEYFITDLIKIDTLTFTIDSVRFPVQKMARDQYFTMVRSNSTTSLPVMYYMERELGGARLYVYFNPSEAYTCEIKGIYRLSEVAEGDDLSLTLDTFYTTYLRYALSQKICDEYAMQVPGGVQAQLNKYQALISKRSRPLDLHIRKISSLGTNRSGNWAWANLFTGYTP